MNFFYMNDREQKVGENRANSRICQQTSSRDAKFVNFLLLGWIIVNLSNGVLNPCFQNRTKKILLFTKGFKFNPLDKNLIAWDAFEQKRMQNISLYFRDTTYNLEDYVLQCTWTD